MYSYNPMVVASGARSKNTAKLAFNVSINRARNYVGEIVTHALLKFTFSGFPRFDGDHSFSRRVTRSNHDNQPGLKRHDYMYSLCREHNQIHSNITKQELLEKLQCYGLIFSRLRE
jgi:hypothetical protein